MSNKLDQLIISNANLEKRVNDKDARTENIRDSVFEPYFSTKEHGTGLGLAIVRRIVEDHNGFIRALSNEPQGTKIVVELPVNITEVVASNQEFSNG